MKKQILGLDINDCFLAAVIVEQKGREKRIVSCGLVEFAAESSLEENLPQLLEQVSWNGGTCVCGISLSGLSLRNFSVPFTEKKKINQILPFELEAQLITPVGEQIVEYVVTGISENSSHLLVAGVEKEIIRNNLETLKNHDLDPVILTPRIVAYAEQVKMMENAPANFLLLDAGLHSISMLIVHEMQVVFMRHLPYPDRMFIGKPFTFNKGKAGVAHADEAEMCVANLSRDIKRSIGFFRLESGLDVSPQQIFSTGCLSTVDLFQGAISAEFGREPVSTNIQYDSEISLSDHVLKKWDATLHDNALALALSGFAKKQLLNFRKDEFTPSKLFFASNTQLLAASVMIFLLFGAWMISLGAGYYSLKTRYDDMGGRMNVIYIETFPETTRIVDPLVQMQANIQGVQAPSISTPVFSGDKRVLNILADISRRIPKNIKLQVSRLIIDKESVRMKGTTETFNNVNIIQSSLRKSPVYDDVDIVSAAADKDSGMIRFELRMQTGGTA